MTDHTTTPRTIRSKITTPAVVALALATVAAPGAASANCATASYRDIQACIAADLVKLREPVDAALAAYARDPSNGCANPHLLDAESLAVGVEHGAQDSAPSLEVGLLAGDLLLDVADAAQAHGCPKLAGAGYREVMEVFVGGGYAALRERAILGITHPVAPTTAQAVVPATKRKARP